MEKLERAVEEKRGNGKKTEFRKTRAFVGDRIRMCQIKKIGKRKHYYNAKAEIAGITEVFQRRWQENETKHKQRENKLRQEKRKRWTVLYKKERSEERLSWEEIKANRARQKYKSWQMHKIIDIISARVRKNDIQESIESIIKQRKEEKAESI